MDNKEKSILAKLYCVGVSFIVMMLASANSFIFARNTFVDPNAFMMVGRRMLKGAVMYKDVYEHKGPYLCLLSEFMCFISSNSYIGMFLVEFVLFSIFLFYSYKILYIYFENNSIMFIPIIAFICLVSTIYTEELSVEQLCIPMLSISLYMLLKFFKEGYEKHIWLINGIFTGIIFWIKYTVLMIYIVWCFVILFYCLKRKDIKKLFEIIIKWAFGILIASIPIVIYFTINNAWYDLYKAYFYNLIVIYPSLARRGPVDMVVFMIAIMVTSIYVFIVLVLGVIGLQKSRSTYKNEICLVSIPLLVFIAFNTYNSKNFPYTWQVVDVFLPVTIVGLINLVKNTGFAKTFSEYIGKKNKRVVNGVILVISLILLCVFSAQFKQLFKKQDGTAAVAFAEEIRKEKDAKMITYRCSDPGIYMELGVTNDMKYFNYYGIWTDEINEEYEKVFADKDVKFVLTSSNMLKKKHENYLIEKGFEKFRESDRDSSNGIFTLWKR